MTEVLKDGASVEVLVRIWRHHQEQTEAAAPPEILFERGESQARKRRSLSPQRLSQGSRVL